MLMGDVSNNASEISVAECCVTSNFGSQEPSLSAKDTYASSPAARRLLLCGRWCAPGRKCTLGAKASVLRLACVWLLDLMVRVHLAADAAAAVAGVGLY